MIVNTVIHRQIEPPRKDTYTKIGDWVFACNLYKEHEWGENIRFSRLLKILTNSGQSFFQTVLRKTKTRIFISGADLLMERA